METFFSNRLLSTMQQVNAVKAKRLFNNGVTVFLQSSNMKFENVWSSAYDINIKCGCSFEQLINSFSTYNCDKERGKRIHYYIQIRK